MTRHLSRSRSLRRGALAVPLASVLTIGVTVLPQEASPAEPPVVWVLATGGTISGGGASSTNLTEYQAGTFSGEKLVTAVPGLADHATIRVEQITNVGSPNLTFDDWLTIARRIDAIFLEDANAAGVVITHGTNTLEETAYFLNLTVRHDRPVVLVGAQRPATAISMSLPPESRPVIVRSNRTGSGRVVPLPAYDERGMIAGDTLNPQKARILLMLALTKTRDVDEIRRIFREY